MTLRKLFQGINKQSRSQIWWRLNEQGWGAVWQQVWQQLYVQSYGWVYRRFNQQLDWQIFRRVEQEITPQIDMQIWRQTWHRIGRYIRAPAAAFELSVLYSYCLKGR